MRSERSERQRIARRPSAPLAALYLNLSRRTGQATTISGHKPDLTSIAGKTLP